ncbi:hypothetical protein AAG570_001772 [Ranatra chinensis]|uniref:Uncharacterized protein n=1 Tax=Ranatra chinensis TaxID=642074 RepID=A0ABD0YLF2_9HEMI
MQLPTLPGTEGSVIDIPVASSHWYKCSSNFDKTFAGLNYRSQYDMGVLDDRDGWCLARSHSSIPYVHVGSRIVSLLSDESSLHFLNSCAVFHVTLLSMYRPRKIRSDHIAPADPGSTDVSKQLPVPPSGRDGDENTRSIIFMPHHFKTIFTYLHLATAFAIACFEEAPSIRSERSVPAEPRLIMPMDRIKSMLTPIRKGYLQMKPELDLMYCLYETFRVPVRRSYEVKP